MIIDFNKHRWCQQFSMLGDGEIGILKETDLKEGMVVSLRRPVTRDTNTIARVVKVDIDEYMKHRLDVNEDAYKHVKDLILMDPPLLVSNSICDKFGLDVDGDYVIISNLIKEEII